MATKKRSGEQGVMARRKDQLDQVQAVIDSLKTKSARLKRQQKEELSQLISVTRGIYEELDKLSKKAPAETVTELALEQINYAIEETKGFLKDDPFVQRIVVFVAAGDNPELRDAVLVLRQLLQGLERYSEGIRPLQERINLALTEAEAIREVLKLYVDAGHVVKGRDELLSISARQTLEDEWLPRSSVDSFLFNKLDLTDIPTYFADRVD